VAAGVGPRGGKNAGGTPLARSYARSRIADPGHPGSSIRDPDAERRSRRREHLRRGPSSGAKIPHPRIPIRLAQLLRRRLHHQFVVQEARRFVSTEEARQPDLTAGRLEQIDASNDEVDVLEPVVDGDGELVGPVSEPIAYQHVSALRRRFLALRPESEVVEALDSIIHAQAPAESRGDRLAAFPAPSNVNRFPSWRPWRGRQLRSRAAAAEEEPLSLESLRRRLVDPSAIALSPVARTRAIGGGGEDVGAEPEPIEIVEYRRFERLSAPLAVVILDPEQDGGVEEPGCTPDVFGVQDVTEVQVTGGRRREPCPHASRPAGSPRPASVSPVTDLPCRAIPEL
jgi:hypothetical protein